MKKLSALAVAASVLNSILVMKLPVPSTLLCITCLTWRETELQVVSPGAYHCALIPWQGPKYSPNRSTTTLLLSEVEEGGGRRDKGDRLLNYGK